MKKLIGIVLLILGLLAGVSAGVKLMNGSGPSGSSGSAGYDAGRKAGPVIVPIVLIALGFWLVNRD